MIYLLANDAVLEKHWKAIKQAVDKYVIGGVYVRWGALLEAKQDLKELQRLALWGDK